MNFNSIKSLLKIVNNFFIVICALLTLSMVSVINYEILARYFLRNPKMWPIEVATFALVYLTFVGGAVCVIKDEELIFTGLINRVSPIKKVFFRIISILISIVFLSYLFYYGIQMTISNINVFSPVARISLAIPYASIPLGAFIMLINKVFFFIEFCLDYKKGEI